jgi:hypothetical protein
MMEDFDEEYTPENPTINEPTLRSITMVPGEVNIEYNSLIDVYRVELKNTIYEDIKSTSSLMRRIRSVGSLIVGFSGVYSSSKSSIMS